MSVDISKFNPFDPATMQCPFPHYAKMREDAPIMEIPGMGIKMVTRHDLVMQTLRDPQTYSSQFGSSGMPLPAEIRKRFEEVYSQGYPRVSTMLTAD